MDALSSLHLQTGTIGAPASTPHAGKTDVRAVLRQRAVDFEAVYLAQMLQPMFAGTEATPPFGGGTGEDIWRSMQTQEYGKAIAQRGGVGIADAVFRELVAAQAAHDGSSRR